MLMGLKFDTRVEFPGFAEKQCLPLQTYQIFPIIVQRGTHIK